MKKNGNGKENKLMQRALALLLCACMIGTLLPLGVFATTVEHSLPECLEACVGAEVCECSCHDVAVPEDEEQLDLEENLGPAHNEGCPMDDTCTCFVEKTEAPAHNEGCPMDDTCTCFVEKTNPVEPVHNEGCPKDDTCVCFKESEDPADQTPPVEPVDYTVTANGSSYTLSLTYKNAPDAENIPARINEAVADDTFAACKAAVDQLLSADGQEIQNVNFFTVAFENPTEAPVSLTIAPNDAEARVAVIQDGVLQSVSGPVTLSTAAVYGVYTVKQTVAQTPPPANGPSADPGDGVVPAALVTVTFYVGPDAEAAGITVPSKELESGAALGVLPTPVWRGENGAIVKFFDGWYVDEALTDSASEMDTVTDNITLYAKWTDPTEDSRYYVNFLSQDGITVHYTVAVDANSPVNAVPGPAVDGKVFGGWSTTLQGDSHVRDLVAFDFGTNVSDSPALVAGKTLNLYAWYGDEVKVNFVTNGASAVPTQLVAAGLPFSAPDISRTGFTFDGWFIKNEDGTMTRFENGTVLNESITLYAQWTAELVPVTLVYMDENADDSEYTPAGINQTVYAPAGTYLSVVKTNITQKGQTHRIGYSYTSGGEIAGYVSDENGNEVRLPDIHNDYFQYSSANNNRLVIPTGSTKMLIYYNRVRATLTFVYEVGTYNIPNENDNHRVTLRGYTEADKYNVKYTANDSGNTHFTYSFTAKYGENIIPVWPQIGWVDTNQTGTRFDGWHLPDNTYQASNKYEVDDKMMGSTSIDVNGKLVATPTIEAMAHSTNTYWLVYAKESIPGEDDPDFTYNDKGYTIDRGISQRAEGSGWFASKELYGFDYVFKDATFNQRYKQWNVTSYKNLNVVMSKYNNFQAMFDDVFTDVDHGGRKNDGGRCEVLLYDRERVKLSIFVNDDVYGEVTPQTKDDYFYGEKIYNDDADLLKTVESQMQKDGHKFAGWYTTADFTDGTQYIPDAETSRINGNMNLYGKWEPTEFTAKYYLYTDETTPYREQGFAENTYITDYLVPPAVQDIFEGWFWYVDGKLERFDFTATVGKNHVDENGELKLYAVWEGDQAIVQYLPGIGGDNETQIVTDSHKYDVNTSSVMLPTPNSTWPDGTVPSDKSLTFVGWKAPNGAIYQPGKYYPVTRHLMQFEAQWSNDAVKLTYNANGGNGSDVTEHWPRNTKVAIWDNMDLNNPHFTRDGYELIGWDENPNATEPTYLLGSGTIRLDTSKNLYAIWKPTTVNLEIVKFITGTMGDRNRTFPFTVTVTYDDQSTPYSFELGDYNTVGAAGGKYVIPGVRKGSTVTVSETDDDYTSSYAVTAGGVPKTSGNGESVTFDIDYSDAGPVEVKFTNHRDGVPETGVVLDSLPYILILGLVAAGAVLLLKRKKHDD